MNESRRVIAQECMQQMAEDKCCAGAKIDAQDAPQPENASVLYRSLMFNSLIQRKAISWTRIFSDLETVLAAQRAQCIASIRPHAEFKGEISFLSTWWWPPIRRGAPSSVSFATAGRLGRVCAVMFLTQTSQDPPTQNDPAIVFAST